MEKYRDLGIALMRFAVGLVFMMHGGQKLLVMGITNFGSALASMGVPLPGFFGPVVVLVEFLGGIALILGLFTRWAAALLAINMTVAVLLVHLKNGFFLPRGFEYALTLWFLNVGLVFTGAGAYALDHVLWRKRGASTELRARAA